MSERYNPNMGFQAPYEFQSGDSKCKAMDLTEYYNTNYTPMFDGKGGAAKKPSSKKSSTAKKAKKPSSKKSSTSKKGKKASTKKRGGADDLFSILEKENISLPYATQTGGTELASEYYTSAQQGSYAPYNASKNEKCGGGHRGGRNMNSSLSQMDGQQNVCNGSLAACYESTKGGGCGCGYKPRTSGTKRGGSDGYYADTITGDKPVVERTSKLRGQLDGGAKAKPRSSSKGTKKASMAKSSSSKGTKKATKPRSSSKGTKSKSKTSSQKHKGGDDSAGGGSDFATTLDSRGPANYPDGKSADLFRIFNKTSEFIPNSMLKYAAAPVSTGYSPDPNPYPRAFNDDFIGGTKKKKPAKKSTSSKSKAKPAKKSTSSSKSKAKPAKKSTSSSKSKVKPAKKSSSSKVKAKKH
jgi:hypothetical protein